MSKKKKIIILIFILLISLLLLLGLTYAFYRTKIINNPNDQSIFLTSRKLQVVYEDGTANLNMSGLIEPGFVATKSFNIKNTSDNDIFINIVFDNVVNEFFKGTDVRGEYFDWVFEIYSGSEINENNLLKNGNITSEETQIVLKDECIKGNTKNEYFVVVKYLFLETINQSADMNSKFSLRINISERTEEIVSSNATLAKFAVSKEYYDSISDTNKDSYLTYEENGLFEYRNEDTGKTYHYYRGAVDNNYVKLGKNSSGNDLYWRILWTSDDNKMKLVLDNEVPMYLTNSNGTSKQITNTNNILYKYYFKRFSKTYIFMSPTITQNVTTYDNNNKEYLYTYKIKSEDFYSTFYDLSNIAYNNLYNTKNVEWYNSTNLSDYSFIVKSNNFCSNTCYVDKYSDGDYDYNPSNTFECLGGSNTCTYKSNDISKPVGFMSYGDLIRAGLIETTSNVNLLNSGNFLINSTNSFITSDKAAENDETDTYKQYYYSVNGIKQGSTYSYLYLGDSNCGSYSCRDYYYTLINETSNTNLVEEYYDYNKNLHRYESYLGTALKPVIVIDTTNTELSNALGTKAFPYEIKTK